MIAVRKTVAIAALIALIGVTLTLRPSGSPGMLTSDWLSFRS